MWRLLLIVSLLTSAAAQAAACCMSASVVGVGRLVVWEDAAAGLSTSWSHGAGRFDAAGRFRPFSAGLLEDELRVEGWAIVRLAQRWEVSARVPWVTGVRASTDGTHALGTGLGDVSAAVRWEYEAPLWLDGQLVTDSESMGLTSSLSASFKLTAHWALASRRMTRSWASTTSRSTSNAPRAERRTGRPRSPAAG